MEFSGALWSLSSFVRNAGSIANAQSEEDALERDGR